MTDASHTREIAGLDVADQRNGVHEGSHLDLSLVRRIDIVPGRDGIPSEAESHGRPLSEDPEWLLHCEAV